MPICEKCHESSLTVTLRQSDDMLCDACDNKRIEGLKRERAQSLTSTTGTQDLESTTSNAIANPDSAPSHHPHEADQDDSVRNEPSAPLADGKDNSTKKTSSKKLPKCPSSCMPGCKVGNKKAKSGAGMIRCCICSQWYHEKCVGLTPGDAIGFWSCPNCRSMAGDIRRVDANIIELTTLVSDLTQFVKRSEIELQCLQSEISHLKKHNDVLVEQNTKLLELVKSPNADTSHTSESVDAMKSLIIGSSIIRNFDESKLPNHIVCCMPGAQAHDVHNRLNELKDEGSKFDSVIIVCGGNDAAAPQDRIDLEASACAMRSAINVAKSMAGSISVAEIIPRAEPAHAISNIKFLNSMLRSISTDLDVQFVSNMEHFYLSSGCINEGYFHDSVHLTVKGSNKLAESLGLKNVVDGRNIGVCSYRPSQEKCFSHKSSSEADNFDHKFWEKARGKASKGKRNAASHTTEPMARPARPARQVSPPHRPLARTDIRGGDARHPGVSARQYTPKSTAGRSHIISQAHNSPRSHQQPQGHQHGVNRHNSHRSVPLPKPMLQSRSNYGQGPHHVEHHQAPVSRFNHHQHLPPASRPPNFYPGPVNPKHGQPHGRNNTDNMAARPTYSSVASYSRRPHAGASRPTAAPVPDQRRQHATSQHGQRAPGYPNDSSDFDHHCCSLCGETNHRSWSCKHGIPIQCYTCSGTGHKSKFCNAPVYNGNAYSSE